MDRKVAEVLGTHEKGWDIKADCGHEIDIEVGRQAMAHGADIEIGEEVWCYKCDQEEGCQNPACDLLNHNEIKECPYKTG